MFVEASASNPASSETSPGDGELLDTVLLNTVDYEGLPPEKQAIMVIGCAIVDIISVKQIRSLLEETCKMEYERRTIPLTHVYDPRDYTVSKLIEMGIIKRDSKNKGKVRLTDLGWKEYWTIREKRAGCE